jgi:phosphatidate cytidylyltransferase
MNFRDLGPRVVSGLLLAALCLGLTVWGVLPFAALVMIVCLLMSWEWARIVRGTGVDLAFAIHAITVVLAVVLTAAGYAAMGIATVLVGAIIVVPIRLGHGARLSALGVLYTGIPAVVLIWLRAAEPLGLAAILFLFIVVWTTDTAAFVAGRAIGGPKLWPAVSPNKTWAGLIGGVGTAVAAAMLYARFVPDASSLRLALAALLLGLVAQAGDLAESALKRAFGVKDASGIIPGHGGFMDRADGLVTAAAAAAVGCLVINMHSPARALLLGY